MRVLLVGLGRAAALALEALRQRPEVTVVGCVDPAPSASPGGLPPVYGALEEVPRAAGVELVLVATPTPTHVAVCRSVLDSGLGRIVACEKPLAIRAADVEGLLRAAAERGVSLRVLYHYAHAAEVAWAAERLDELERSHGRLAAAAARFEDPYAGDPERGRVLVSSWVDSGINALSVLERIVGVVRLVGGEARHDRPHTGEATLELTRGEARITTRWDVQDEVKRTTLRFEDGSELVLDHPTQTAALGGRVLFRGEGDARRERYRRLIAAQLDGEGVFGDAVTLRLHRMLEGAM